MNYLYTDIHMGASHNSLRQAAAAHGLKKGDAAVFINRAWTAAKIMTHRDAYIYVRRDKPFGVDELARFPQLVGANPLMLTRGQIEALNTIRQKAGVSVARPLPRAVA